MRKDVANKILPLLVVLWTIPSFAIAQLQPPLCDIPYELLDRQVFLYSDSAPVYRLDGKLFNGCAFQAHPEHQSKYYYVIRNGWVDQELGFYDTGLLSREFNFKDGKPHGVHAMYREDGSLYIEEYYHNGKSHGTKRRWHANGQLARDASFEHGHTLYDHSYDLHGVRTDKR